MSDYKIYFSGKKITLMGLGLLGRGLGDAIFLAEHGADLIVADMRNGKILAPSLAKLKKFRNIRYTLGRHKLEDFRNRDFILKAAGVPLDSPYIAEARRHDIPIEMDASLFAKLMPNGVVLIGVTGTRGKSTTAELLYSILKAAKKRTFLGGVVHTATLPLLEKVRAGDMVVLELDSWQLQGFHDAKISPHIAAFTTFMDDHLLYYKGDRERYFYDKTAIFRYQKTGDALVVGEQVLEGKSNLFHKKGGTLIARAADVPKGWRLQLIGEHNRGNAACALAVARALKIPDRISRMAMERFGGVPGRLEYLRTVRGVKICNDNNATTPDATIAALYALNSKSQKEKSIILICGGTDKGLDMSKLVAEIPKQCKAVVLLKETGTAKIQNSKIKMQNDNPDLKIYENETLKECVKEAMRIAEKGDIVLFSPAFASFGRWFKNEYDRGEQFVKILDIYQKTMV